MNNYFHIHRKPISLVITLIIVCGIYLYSQIKISLFPEITFPKIKIIADNGEQPVDKMMTSVTIPLENTIKQVPDLKVIKSITSRGSCEISAFFKWHSNINVNMQMIGTRIDQIKNELPPSTQIDIEMMNPSILQVMGFTLESNNKNPIELSLIARYIIKPYFSQVEGISSVQIIGGRTKEYWLILNTQKMSSLAITPDMISNVLGQTNFINSIGYLNDYHRMYLTTVNAGLYNIHDIENVIIKNDSKRSIRLNEIANVEIHEKVEYTRINANGKPAILISILKQPNANLIEVSKNVLSKKTELEKILPKGVRLSMYYNQSEFVDDAISSVNDSVWIGLLLSIILTVLFLRSLRVSLTILITIPVSLLLSFIILYSLGYTLNIMTLGAIAASIGLVIDDTIVVSEQIHRVHEENPDEETHTQLHQTIRFLFPAMLGSTISTTVIFVPFILLSGVAGAYFRVLTNTMIIILVCSFFVTWFGLPIIYMILPSFKKRDKKQKTIIKKIRFRQFVSFLICKPVISLIFIALLIFSIFLILPRLQTGFLPEMDEGSIVLDYSSPPGTSLDETDMILKDVEKIIINIPEFDSYSRRTGAQMGFFITEPNTGDYLIKLKKIRKRTTTEVIDDIRNRIEATQPALRIDFGQVIGDMLGDLMASVQPIEIKIFGDNPVKLHELAEKVAYSVEKVKGTADVFCGITLAGPSVEVEPHVQKLTQFGLTPANLNLQMQTMMQGTEIGTIPEKEQYSTIRMIYPGSLNTSVDRLKQQFIFLPNAKLKPITELADIKIREGTAEIERENLKSLVIVTARLNERDIGSVMKDIDSRLKSDITLPEGYYINYGGAYQDQKNSFRELLLILILSSLLIFTLMLFLFRKFRVALVIIIISVLGVSGSLIALFITNTPLNVGSYTGLIMIVGIIGENAIFSFRQFSVNLTNSAMDESLIDAMAIRLRPILMTALGAITALLPLALGIGTGAQMHQPLAIAVIGGFFAELPLLLFVFPALLRLFYKTYQY